jgi:uncharacterized protein (DUF2336 family)
LLRNATAKISGASYETLVEKSRAFVRLQEPLTRRPDLPPQLANDMCEWVSEALKVYIRTNYHMSEKRVDAALNQAATQVKSDPPSAPVDSAQKLIDKLAAAGQLKAGFLIRILSQGQTDLFDLAFARLLDMELSHFRRLFYESGARAVALGCRAAGIDRSVFPTVFNLSRQSRGRHVCLGAQEIAEAGQVFIGFTRESALEEMRTTATH